MGVVLNIEVGISDLEMVDPVFKCACGKPTIRKVCNEVGPNEARAFLRCDVGYVENNTSPVLEDPKCKRHLACDVWIWEDVITRFARTCSKKISYQMQISGLHYSASTYVLPGSKEFSHSVEEIVGMA